nr:PREDICTED: putative SERF-like protein [Tribolium castaneum]|eukprot:XP_008198263.1 PREDICTED: putative SERF-like protein [Tribolium castaneum]
MTRGNQRELARAKFQKRQEKAKSKLRNDGLTLEQRKFRDAEKMREKQRKKSEQSPTP